MRAWTWLWAEGGRRNLVLALAAVLGVVILVVVVRDRVHDGQQTWQTFKAKAQVAAPGSLEAAAVEEDHDDIVRPSGQDTATSAVQAWLTGDREALAQVASADLAMLLAARTPAPQEVTGAELVEDFDTFQSWSVALADGTHALVDLSWARNGEDGWTAVSVVLGA